MADGSALVELIGPRVRLRAPRAEDADALFESVASDPEVTRYLSWLPHPSVEETRRVLAEQFNVSDDPTWVVELHATGQLVGTCAWERPRPHTVEFGFCLGRRWWRQGLMSESAQLVVDQARRDPDVYRVSAYCHVDNVASAGVLKRCGLDCEGRLTRYAVFPNLDAAPQDCLMFATAVR